MFKEFKEFALKGDVVDLAIGVIIGGAFGKIVTSLVNDIIMPPFGALLGGIDFTKMSWTLKAATDNIAAVNFNYGNFINNVVDFVIVAFVIFLVVKQMNKFRKKETAKKEKPVAPEDVQLLREIRDTLKKK